MWNMPDGSARYWNDYERSIQLSEYISDCAEEIEADFHEKQPEIILLAHMELDGEDLAEFVSDVNYWSRNWFGDLYFRQYDRRAFNKWQKDYE